MGFHEEQKAFNLQANNGEIKMIMPAEFHEHEATWLVWPRNKLTFGGGKKIKQVEGIYLHLIDCISALERVELVVYDEDEMDRVKASIGKKNIHYNIIESCDVWVRDYGPIFVYSNGQVVAVKWKFNAWGRKYTDLLYDEKTGIEIAKKASRIVLRPRLVLEGGAIEVNGQGLCLSTKSCLLDKKRNNNITEDRLLSYLKRYLGIKKVIWLEGGLPGDDTDGHVDNIARFVKEKDVVTIYSDAPGWGFTKRNLERLKKIVLNNNERLEVYILPVPEERTNLPFSYANFYIMKKFILMPIFGSKKDEIAISVLESASGKRVIPIKSNALLEGFGGIHCITQQQPLPRDSTS